MGITPLRYFLATVEHGGFRAAARELNVAQPALMRQVRKLEDNLGVALLRRDGGAIVATEIGHRYAGRIRAILNDLAKADEEARRSATDLSLKIGVHKYFAGFQQDVMNTLDYFRSRHSGTQLLIEPQTSAGQIEMIAHGELDGGFLYDHRSPFAHLEHITLAIDRWMVALPRQHSLAARSELHLKDLQREPFVSVSRDILPAAYDALEQHCRERGLSRRIVRQTDSVSALFTMVGTGVGLCFMHTPITPPDSIVLRDVVDLDAHLKLDFVWDPANENPALPCLVDSLRGMSLR